MSSSASRYAIYFTPSPETPLAVFGARLLGYDPDQGLPVAQMELSGVDREDLAAATEAPRRYGFHATIVAPFYLGDGPEEKLIERFRVFCNRTRPAQLGRLAVTPLDHLVALTPVTACADVDDLGSDRAAHQGQIEPLAGTVVDERDELVALGLGGSGLVIHGLVPCGTNGGMLRMLTR